jgi:DNA invertase Pin-like site-specific DNA recombinase
MRIKYNRVSTIQQTGNRFSADNEKYDLVLLDKISGSVKFKDREKTSQLIKLVEDVVVKEIVFEELSRCGRNTGDVIQTLDWLLQHVVNVVIRNLEIQSRPNGKKNPIWKLICATMGSLYEMEFENIKERTSTGRMVYVQNGGVLDRPTGSNENIRKFHEKPKNNEIKKYIIRGMSYSEISKLLDCSPKNFQSDPLFCCFLGFVQLSDLNH